MNYEMNQTMEFTSSSTESSETTKIGRQTDNRINAKRL